MTTHAFATSLHVVATKQLNLDLLQPSSVQANATHYVDSRGFAIAGVSVCWDKPGTSAGCVGT